MSRSGGFYERFLEMMSAERGAAQNTLDAYRRDLDRFAAFLGTQNPDSAQAQDIAAYLRFLHDEGLGARSRARQLSALRQYFSFLLTEGDREDDPTSMVDMPKQAPYLPDVLSINDVQRLMVYVHKCVERSKDMLRQTQKQVKPDKKPHKKPHKAYYKKARRAYMDSVQMQAMISLLYASGLRVSELLSLKKSDFRPHQPFMTVMSKGRKERLVPLNKEAIAALKAHLELTKDEQDCAFIFSGLRGDAPMTRQVFARKLKKWGQAAGLNASQIKPHGLRHAFASHLLQNGADLRALQTLLGHADIATTQIYTHVLDQHLKQLVLEHHPLAKIQAQKEHASF